MYRQGFGLARVKGEKVEDIMLSIPFWCMEKPVC